MLIFFVFSGMTLNYLFLESLFEDLEVDEAEERELPFDLGDLEVRLSFLFLPCLRLVDSTELEARRRSLCFFSFRSFLSFSLERSRLCLGEGILPLGVAHLAAY